MDEKKKSIWQKDIFKNKWFWIVFAVILIGGALGDDPAPQKTLTEEEKQGQQERAREEIRQEVEKIKAEQNEKEREDRIKYIGVGGIGMVNSSGDPADCEGIASIAFTEDALDDLIQAANANDEYGYREIISEGRAAVVENCTSIRVIETKFSITKVRVIDDPSVAGWVPYEWAIASN